MDGLDLARLGRLLALMEAPVLRGLAAELARGLAALPGVAVAARADHLHRLRGGAATLGFAGLAAALAEAEADPDAAQIAAISARADTILPLFDAAVHALSRQR